MNITRDKPFLKPVLIPALALLLSSCAVSQKDNVEEILPGPYHEREDVKDWAAEFSAENGFDESIVLAILSEGRHRPNIIRLMDRSPEGTWDWGRYKKFVDEDRIESGVEFWLEHEATLARAETEFGVPPEYILGILAMETRFGRIMGSTRVLDALMTLGFDYPRRATFFKKELGHFLLMATEERFDPLSILGSYAGAMGYGQFMPSSYRNYAVDFDGDDVRDLLENPVDAIGSTAAYLSNHGWIREGESNLLPVKLRDSEDDGDLSYNRFGFNKAIPVEKLLEVLEPLEQGRIPDEEKGWPVRLVDGETNYFIGFANYHAITRYNHSRLYSTAVVELAKAIKERRRQELE